jgi:hypothetical protein
MTGARLTDVWAAIGVFWGIWIFKIFEIVEFFGEIEDAWTLPVSSGKSSMLLAFFSN